MPGFMINY